MNTQQSTDARAYKLAFLIPTVLGGMALFVASDVFRRVKDRFRGKKTSGGDAGTLKEN